MTDMTYSYRDATGQLLYQVVRHDPKAFSLFDADGLPLDKFPDATVLYRLPELLDAPKNAIINITEGEKDADRLAELGLIAVTNPGGCRVGWRPEYSAHFVNRYVVILADNDRPGARHAERIEMSLRSTAAIVKILKLPRLRRAEDVSDWLDFRKGTRDELLKLAKRCVQEATPGVHKPAKGHAKRKSVFLSVTLTSSERLLLLAIQHHAGDPAPFTAGDLAAETALHRVSVQRLIASLTKRSILARREGRLEIRWEHVV